MQFDEALQVGEDVEYMILKQIQNKYPRAYKVEGKHSEYDLYIPELRKSIEVKRDEKSKCT